MYNSCWTLNIACSIYTCCKLYWYKYSYSWHTVTSYSKFSFRCSHGASVDFIRSHKEIEIHDLPPNVSFLWINIVEMYFHCPSDTQHLHSAFHFSKCFKCIYYLTSWQPCEVGMLFFQGSGLKSALCQLCILLNLFCFSLIADLENVGCWCTFVLIFLWDTTLGTQNVNGHKTL